VATRAVPFAEQARVLRRTYLQARHAGTLLDPPSPMTLRDGSRGIRRARRALRRGDFAGACVELAVASGVLSVAAGSAQPTLQSTLETLRADLGC
jgi:hypothetical protein